MCLAQRGLAELNTALGRTDSPGIASEGPAATAVLAAVLAAAIAFRLYLLATTNFPLNDGALFLEFVRATAASFPALPTTVAYNGVEIPFTYSPLSFWVGALLTKLGFPALEVVRVVPILINTGYVLLFAALLRRAGHSRLFIAAALLFFITRVRSFEWLVMGGGLSRGFGALFFILALIALAPLFAQERRQVRLQTMPLAGVATGAAILSHLEWGIDAAAAVILAVAVGSPDVRTFVTRCLIAGAAALTVIAPWLLSVVGTHGVDPFLAAGGSSKWGAAAVFELVMFLVRTAATNPFVMLGCVALLAGRQLFWIGLLIAIIVLTPRHAGTAANLPLAVTAAVGAFAAHALLSRVVRVRPAAFVAIAAAFLALTAVRVWRDGRLYGQTVRELSSAQRGAMAWVAGHHPGAAFALVTRPPWESDHAAEWFPTLARARSVGTVQGSEWLDDGVFIKREAMARAIKGSTGCRDLLDATAAYGRVDYVWAEFGPTCFANYGLQPIFANSEVTIFRAGGRS